MATMKVTDRSNGKIYTIKIDSEDLDRLKNYNYALDQHHAKPFREEKIDGYIRRIFLARDVIGFKFGDKRIVSYKNQDIYDCRKENLVEGRVTAEHKPSASGHFWPHTFKGLINFLDNQKGINEELVSQFFAKSIKTKYTKKRIDLIFNDIDYTEYKAKNIQLLMMQILNRYFDWGGQVSAAKDLTPKYQNTSVSTSKASIVPEVSKEVIKEITREVLKETPREVLKEDTEKETAKKKVTRKVKAYKASTYVSEKRGNKLEEEEEPEVEVANISILEDQLIRCFSDNKKKVLDIISQHIPIEDLISLVMERGASSKLSLSIQINSK